MTDPSSHIAQTVQHVYRGQGRTERAVYCAAMEPDHPQGPSAAGLVAVTQIMTREVSCARQDLDADLLVELLVRKRLGCVPIVNHDGRPVGMVTKLDVIEQLLSTDRGEMDLPTPKQLTPRTARELMMPIAITLGEHATVSHAAALMAAEGIHHLPIVDEAGQLVGILSTMDLVRWLASNDGYNAPSPGPTQALPESRR